MHGELADRLYHLRQTKSLIQLDMCVTTFAGKPLGYVLQVYRKYYEREAFRVSFNLAAIIFHVTVCICFLSHCVSQEFV